MKLSKHQKQELILRLLVALIGLAGLWWVIAIS